MRRGFFTFCVLLLAKTIMFSQDSLVLAELIDLSFAELLDVRVSVSDKSEKSVLNTPGSVVAYESSDVTDLGYYTLAELSKVTSGYGSYYIFGENVFETRGTKAGSFNNNKHLVLVDGIPVNHSRNYRAPSDYDLPLMFADKIEFLRGPGSALYGTSAFNGVISITPYAIDSLGTASQGVFSYGGSAFGYRFMTNTCQRSEKGDLNLSVGYYDKESDGDFVGNDSLAQDSNYRNWNHEKSFFFNSSYAVRKGRLSGLKVGMIYMNKLGGLGEFWGGPSSEINELQWESLIPYLKYNREIGIFWRVDAYYKYNRGIEKGVYANNGIFSNGFLAQPIVTEYQSEVDNMEFLFELTRELGIKGNFRVGLNYDNRKQLAGPNSYEVRVMTPDSTGNASYQKTHWEASDMFNTLSAFAQFDYNFDILAGTYVVLGVRNDNGFTPTNTYSRVSPRLSIVQMLHDKVSFKVLYGSALRAPGLKEVGLNAEARAELNKNNEDDGFLKDLEAEFINSLETSINFDNRRIRFSLTGFRNKTENALDGFSVEKKGVSYNYFANSDQYWVSTGLEFDMNAACSRNFSVFSNLSYSETLDKDGNNFYGVPRSKINLGVVLKDLFNDRIMVSVINRFIDGYFIGNELISEPYHQTDMNVRAELTSNLALEFQLKNLFDAQFKQPGGNGPRYDIPVQGFHVIGSLRATF